MQRRAFLFALAAVPLVLACEKPKPPTLVVVKAQVTGVDARGMTLSVQVQATNPNDFDLVVSSFAGALTLEGKPAGNLALVRPITLTPGAARPLEVPLSLTWNDAGAIALLAISGKDLTYTFDGLATVGGSKITLPIPIAAKGTIPNKDIAKAAQKSLPALPFALPK